MRGRGRRGVGNGDDLGGIASALKLRLIHDLDLFFRGVGCEELGGGGDRSAHRVLQALVELHEFEFHLSIVFELWHKGVPQLDLFVRELSSFGIEPILEALEARSLRSIAFAQCCKLLDDVEWELVVEAGLARIRDTRGRNSAPTLEFSLSDVSVEFPFSFRLPEGGSWDLHQCTPLFDRRRGASRGSASVPTNR